MNHGQTNDWFPGSTEVTDYGNSLINNADIDIVKKGHRICLFRLGGLKPRTRPVRADLICAHAEKYWVRTGIGDITGVQLHAIFLVGFQCSLRYEESLKFR